MDDKPMVIHTKEKPPLKIKGAPETKIKGRNVLAVRHGPKVAEDVAEKNVASSLSVTDKRKTGQTKTDADGMENGSRYGGNAQGRNTDTIMQGRQGKERTAMDKCDVKNPTKKPYDKAVCGKAAAGGEPGQYQSPDFRIKLDKNTGKRWNKIWLTKRFGGVIYY